MPHYRKSLLDRTKLSLVHRIIPVKQTDIILLDQIDIDLGKARINQVSIPSMPKPQITSDICPDSPNMDEQEVLLDEPTIEELTLWLNEQFVYPEIENIPLLLKQPRRAGKVYSKASKEESSPLTSSEFLLDADKTCKHGLKKKWCSFCREDTIEKARKEKEKAASVLDPFDMIFPILHPPLGDNFDNPIAFSQDKQLYDFQCIGVKFLLEHERALLGDEMGLGKSIQAIVALRVLFRMGKANEGLILCPKSVLTDWERKLWDWAPELRVTKVHGNKDRRTVQWKTPSHIYIATYESMRQDLAGSLDGSDQSWKDIAKKRFDFVVADEIQKIKNPSADITKAIRLVESPLRWGLSGTPLENRLEDLISIFAYLKPNLLRYDDAQRPWKIKEGIKPYLLRRKSEAIPDFPEVFHDEKWIDLSPAQREAYDRAEVEGIVALNEQGDSITVQHIFALVGKLKQICNMDPVSKESSKLDWLTDSLEEICDQGDKALVFSQYPEKTLKFLEPSLKRFNPLIYHGSLSDSKRDQMVETFQQEEENKVLLMSVKSGGVGLTLHKANHVVHFDLWWNPSVAAQAEGRARRIGQKKTVFVTSLLTIDTIEERIDSILRRKRALFDDVINGLSDTNLSKVLTEEELFSLFGVQKAKQTAKSQASPVGTVLRKMTNQTSPQQFEQYVAELYEKMGYHVKLTPQSRDHGVDVYAKRSSEVGIEEFAIQCKHYPNGVVGVEHARSLYGVIHDKPNITKGILVTSGEFSKDCREFSKGKRIELVDRTRLTGLFEKYGISVS